MLPNLKKNQRNNALFFTLISLGLLASSGCSWINRMTGDDEPLTREEIARLDEEMQQKQWEVPDGPRQSLRPRSWDLEHQKLWIRFDFNRREVIGRTELFLTNLSHSADELVLDAKTMDFEQISLMEPERELHYRQDSATVTIELPREYHRQDSLFIEIDYVAAPPERGLYFVDPKREDPTVPTQVWTLGQPEDNSFWFPTIDHPAERMTQEVWLSVPDTMQTLSNGALIESRMAPGDSLRTDYWRLKEPHAPYLTALAVGEFHIKERLHDGIVMRYYTEPFYSEHIDEIYAHTEEMFDYIHEHLETRYPWGGIYSQVPVHEYIAGGMENTTATILHDGVQFNTRAAQDRSNQGLIMHEIIHHWFGNLVTARNWANLPLNEGFANYFEILFRQHLQGDEGAAWKNLNYRNTYFNEAQEYRRPVIWNRYEVPEDMYDRHTYQKAGQILRMLHDYLGDDRWWAALNAYLDEYRFEAVDIDDMQQVFERETGEDLNWFFRQWFHEPGHPTLEVRLDSTGTRQGLRVRQVHDTERQPLFRLKAEAELITDDGRRRVDLTVDRQDSLYTFEEEQVRDIIFDPGRVQLAEYIENPGRNKIFSRLNHPEVAVRAETLGRLYEARWDAEVEEKVREMAIEDDFWAVRNLAMELLRHRSGRDLTDPALNLTYENEKEGEVRVQAFYMLQGNNSPEVERFARKMVRDTSYYVAAEALKFYGEHFPENVHEIAPEFIERYSYQHIMQLAAVNALSHSAHPEAFAALKQAARHDGNREYIRSALGYLTEFDLTEEQYRELIDLYSRKIEQSPHREIRMRCYYGLGELGATEQLDVLEARYDEAESAEERNVLETVIEGLREEV